MADPHWIGVGRIRGSHGVQGALKIEPYAAASESVLRHARRWRLVEAVEPSADGAPAGQIPAPRSAARPLALPQIVRRGRCRLQGDALVAELVLLALKGVEIQVDRADCPPTQDDEFYHADLIGCEVIGQQGARLGTVVAVDDHGAQQVLRLDDGMLIPFVEAIVQSVDIAARRIQADWAADWR